MISISDPGHFMPGLISSFYVGSATLNYNQVVAGVIENICNLAKIKLNKTMLFGSSAGTMGALLCSTYLKCKTNVLAVNSQINLHYRKDLMQPIFGIDKQKKSSISLATKFPVPIDSIRIFSVSLTYIYWLILMTIYIKEILSFISNT